jgi:predicted transposase/invertase (TIGR01784 family)
LTGSLELERKDLLPLRNDIIFKMTFGDARNTRILRAFLLAVLDLPEEEYDEIEVIDPQLRINSPDEKLGILDVHIKTKSGQHIDVEVQIARTPFIQERIVTYTAKMLTAQLSVGERYTEMKKVISILILDYDLIRDTKYFHNKYLLCDAETKSLLTNIIEIHTLELQKLPEEGGSADEKIARQILWLRLIKARGEEEIKVLAAQSPEINEAYGVLKKLSESEAVRLLYESREKAIWDEQARLYGATKEGFEKGLEKGIEKGLEKGIEKGLEEGLEKGREEGKRQSALATASRLLAMNLDAESIALATGLTAEEIQSLQSQPSPPEPIAQKHGRGRPMK